MNHLQPGLSQVYIVCYLYDEKTKRMCNDTFVRRSIIGYILFNSDWLVFFGVVGLAEGRNLKYKETMFIDSLVFLFSFTSTCTLNPLSRLPGSRLIS